MAHKGTYRLRAHMCGGKINTIDLGNTRASEVLGQKGIEVRMLRQVHKNVIFFTWKHSHVQRQYYHLDVVDALVGLHQR